MHQRQASSAGTRLASRIGFSVSLIVFALCLSAQALADEARFPLAVSGFFLIDTSGEQRDQSAEHRERLTQFDKIVHDELAKSDSIALVEMQCPQQRCSRDNLTFEQLVGFAREAGAKYLAIGAINKMSTLVLWSRVEIYDVATGKMVMNRLYTFRGDNDEAWRRAARYTARDVIKGAAAL